MAIGTLAGFVMFLVRPRLQAIVTMPDDRVDPNMRREFMATAESVKRSNVDGGAVLVLGLTTSVRGGAPSPAARHG